MRVESPPPYVGPPPVPKMPAGLVDLVEGLTREVLKNNPKDVYEFCAKHLEKLLESRDGSSFKKPMLTLEQKIHIAQEKVRQKAKERREKYDRELKAVGSIKETPTTELQQTTDKQILNSESDISVINAMPPVYHENGLKSDCEVEIAHKAPYIADEENTHMVEHFEIKNVETLPKAVKVSIDDINRNIDLANGKEIYKDAPVQAETTSLIKADDEKLDIHVNILPAADDITVTTTKLQDKDIASDVKGDSETAHSKENITDKIQPAPITEIFTEENIIKSDAQHDSLHSAKAVTEGSDIKEESCSTKSLNKNISAEAPSDSQRTKSVTEENMIKSEAQNDLLSSATTVTEGSDIKEERNSTKSSNKNISEKAPAESQRESDLPTVAELEILTIETKHNKDETPSTENKLDSIQNNENMISQNIASVIETNLHGNDGDVSLLEDRDKLRNANSIDQELKTVTLTVPNKTVIIIEDTSITSQNLNCEDISDLNFEKENTQNQTNVTTNGNNTYVVTEPVGTQKNLTILDKEKDHAFDATTNIEQEIQKQTEKTKALPTEQENSTTSKLNHNITDNLKEKVNEVASNESKEISGVQGKEDRDIDIPSVQVSENLKIINDDASSLVESDLSKIEEDTTGENQNGQNNMDLETAAVTIQKVFRTFLFKSRNSTFDDGTNDESTSLDDENDNIKKEEYYAAANVNKERRPLGISRMDTMLQTVNEEKSLSLSTDDSSTLSSAATTIQAHVRGFLVRNRLNSNKTLSTNSVNSNEFVEPDTEQQKNKTVLNIHIVPEESNYLSRDESIITSMELSLDASPPSSVNLHPLSYDVSERRKLLKREDAVQSISPPSNNSGKLSEESVKELIINDETVESNVELETDKRSEETVEPNNDSGVDSEAVSISSTATATTIINITDFSNSPEHKRSKSLQNFDHDEADVVTPYFPSPRSDTGDYDHSSKLVHSGEFHDALLPTRVIRNDSTVVREFKNVLVYFIIWNH